MKRALDEREAKASFISGEVGRFAITAPKEDVVLP
jgi:hypothetical protein